MNTEVFDLGKIGITLGGEYDNQVIYEKLTIVLYKGKSYISTKTVQGISPEQDIRSWQLVAEAKDAYHMLVDAGRTTLTEEEFLEQLEDATKGRYIVQGNIINLADEEDLTNVNINSTNVLKFKDKAYNPLTYSGMGRVVLRKKLINGKNTLTQNMINKSDTIYVIQYDFTLGIEETINSVTLSGTTQTVDSHTYYYQEIVVPAGKCIRLKDENCVLLKSPLGSTAEDIITSNNYCAIESTTLYIGCHFEGTYQYSLSDYVTIPENCVLKFDGGSISNGTLLLNNTIIDAEAKVFSDVNFSGTIRNTIIDAAIFGNKTSEINKIFGLKTYAEIVFPRDIIYDETLIPNPGNSLTWIGGRTNSITGNKPFVHIRRSSGNINFKNSTILVNKTYTGTVILFDGATRAWDKNEDLEKPHTYELGRVVGDCTNEDLYSDNFPKCLGLHIRVDHDYSFGYLYYATINVSCKSIKDGVKFSLHKYDNGTTNTCCNVYNINTWGCINALEFQNDDNYNYRFISGEIFNLTIQPYSLTRKYIKIDNLSTNYWERLDWDNVIFNITTMDSSLIEEPYHSELVDFVGGAIVTNKDFPKIPETLAAITKTFNTYYAQTHAMFDFNWDNFIVSDYSRLKNYYFKDCTTEMTPDQIVSKLVENVAKYNGGSQVTLRFPMSIENYETLDLIKSELRLIVQKLLFNDATQNSNGLNGLCNYGICTIDVSITKGFHMGGYRGIIINYNTTLFDISKCFEFDFNTGTILSVNESKTFKNQGILSKFIPLEITPDNYKDGNVHWDNTTGTPKIFINSKDELDSAYGAYFIHYGELPVIIKTTSANLSSVATDYPKMCTANSKGIFRVWLTDLHKEAIWDTDNWYDVSGNLIS